MDQKGPLTRIIAGALEEQICTGVFQPGDKLPTVRELAERYRSSTSVCLSAYRALEKKGLLRREVGRGTFVSGGEGAGKFRSDRIYFWNRIFPINSTGKILAEIQERSGGAPLETETFATDVYEDYRTYLDLLSSLGKSGGKAPGLVAVNEGLVPPLDEAGALHELDALLDASPVLKRGDFPEELLFQMSRNGKLLGIPIEFSPVVLFYHRDVFRKFGIAEPDGDWNWQTLLDRIHRLGERSDSGGMIRYGLGILFYHLIYGSFVFQNGGDFFDRSGNCVVGSAATCEALQFFSTLYNLPETCHPVFGDLRDGFIDLFINGFCAMLIGEATDYKLLSRRMPREKFGIVRLPYSRIPAGCVSSRGWSISRQSRDPERLFRLLEQIVLRSREAAYHETLIGLPAFRPEESGCPPEMLDVLAHGRVLLSSPRPEAHRALTDTVTMMLAHRMDITPALCKRFQDQINQRI